MFGWYLKTLHETEESKSRALGTPLDIHDLDLGGHPCWMDSQGVDCFETWICKVGASMTLITQDIHDTHSFWVLLKFHLSDTVCAMAISLANYLLPSLFLADSLAQSTCWLMVICIWLQGRFPSDQSRVLLGLAATLFHILVFHFFIAWINDGLVFETMDLRSCDPYSHSILWFISSWTDHHRLREFLDWKWSNSATGFRIARKCTSTN